MDAEFPADEDVVFGEGCDPTNGERDRAIAEGRANPLCWMRAPEARPRARIDIEASRGIDAKAVLPNKMDTVKGNTQRCKGVHVVKMRNLRTSATTGE